MRRVVHADHATPYLSASLCSVLARRRRPAEFVVAVPDFGAASATAALDLRAGVQRPTLLRTIRQVQRLMALCVRMP